MTSISAQKIPQMQHDYDAVLAQNGRTFHWARRFLGKTHGNHAARLYAFCRLLDDLADGDLPNGKYRLMMIQDDLKRLSLLPDSLANDPAMQDFAPFMKALSIPPMALGHLIEGLLFDQGAVALESEKDLIIYGYQVAGTVGLMMCPILSCHDKLAFDFAIDLGIAMQLTNIARDVLEDAHMGRRYLPAEWTGALSATQIAQGALSQDEAIISPIKQALSYTLDLADRYYESGLSGLAFLPKRAQISIAVAAYAYREIGVQLRHNDLAWHHGRTVTSTMTKAKQSLKALPYCLPRAKPAAHDTRLHLALEGYAK